MIPFEVSLEAMFEDANDQPRIMVKLDAEAERIGKTEGKILKLDRTQYTRRVDLAGNPIHFIATYKEVTNGKISHN